MNRIIFLGTGLLLAAALTAQEPEKPADPVPPQAQLKSLLEQLQRVDGSAWAARMRELEEQAKGQETKAAEQRAAALELQQKAAASENAAKQLRTEIARLKELQSLLDKLAGGTETKDGAKPAPKPSAEEKPKSEEKPRTAEKPKEPPAPKPAAPSPAPAAPAATPPQKPAAEPKGMAPAPVDARPVAAAQVELVTWKAHIEPVMEEHCASCHEPDNKKGGIDVTTYAAIRQGGGSGKSIVPGEPDQSRLYLMVAHQERPFMPKDEDALPPQLVQRIRTWIEQGAAENEAGARAFLDKKEAAARAAAAEAAAAAATPAVAPMPTEVRGVELAWQARMPAVRGLVRSPTAPLLAMAGLQQLVLADADARLLAALPCAMPRCDLVTFSPDGSLVAVAGGQPGRKGELRWYDVVSGAELGVLQTERDALLAAAVHRGASLAAVGGAGKHCRVFRTTDGSELFSGKHDDFVLSVDVSPDGSLVAAADRSGTVLVWEVRGGRLGQTLAGHKGAVHSVSFHRSGKQVASAGADGTVRMWDVAEGKERWRQQAHTGDAFAVAFGPGDTVASCGADGRIRTFDRAGKPLLTSPAVDEWLYSIAFGATDDVLHAGDWRGRIHRWEPKTKKLAQVSIAPAAQ